MKVKYIIFSFLIGLTLASCQKDDGVVDCYILEENIVGVWISEDLGEGYLEFVKGGELKDPDDILTSYYLNDDEYKKKEWSVSGNDRLNINGVKIDNSIGIEVFVTKLTCDTITLFSGSFEAEMIRK